jgi:hypothetical protein
VATERDAGFVRLAAYAISKQDEDCSTSSVLHFKYRSAPIRLSQLISSSGHHRFIHDECERDVCDHAIVPRSDLSDKWASDSCGHQNSCQNAFHIQSPLVFFFEEFY